MKDKEPLMLFANDFVPQGGPDLSGELKEGGAVDYVSRRMSRAALALNLVIGATGLAGGGYLLFQSLENMTRVEAPVDPGIAATLEALQRDARDNVIYDCLNENVLRQALGAPPVDVATCRGNRAAYGERNKHLMLTPTPTPRPVRSQTPQP